MVAVAVSLHGPGSPRRLSHLTMKCAVFPASLPEYSTMAGLRVLSIRKLKSAEPLGEAAPVNFTQSSASPA
jgi:hypothetical protein